MFILAEEAAMHRAVEGIEVDDFAATSRGERRSVGVRYGFPEAEVKDRDYPFISIDLVDILRDTTREHRGYRPMPYTPDEPGYEQFVQPEGTADTQAYGEWPVPYNLLFMVATYSRNVLQDRAIQHHLMWNVFRRDAVVVVGGTPVEAGTPESGQHSAEQTQRRLVLQQMSRQDTRDRNNGKRLFRQVYGCYIESELPPRVAVARTAAINEIRITLNSGHEVDEVLAVR